MRSLTRILATTLLCTLAGAGAARGADCLGVYFDPAATNRCDNPALYSNLSVYVVATEVTSSIAGYEMKVTADAPGLMYLNTTLAGTGALNVLTAPEFQVGLTTPIPPGAAVLLMTMDYLVLSASPGTFKLGPVTAPSLPGQPCFAKEDNSIVPFNNCCSGDWSQPLASIYTDCPSCSPGPVTWYYYDFRDGARGWGPVDLNAKVHHLQRITDLVSVPERGVWWCGAENVPGWVDASGYGNNWDECLSKTFVLPSGPVQLDWVMQHDTEPGYDFVRIEISADGGATFSSLASFDGSSSGEYVAHTLDLSAYAEQTVILRFRFTSDGGWSDQDGSYDSNGAFRLDSVQITGFEVDDFEAADDGWAPSPLGPPLIPAEFRLEAEPVCDPGAPSSGWPCDTYTGGNPIVACNTWVAYGENGQFPDVSVDQHAEGSSIHIGIESPNLTIPADAAAVTLAFDVFADLPMNLGVYYHWQVSTDDGATWLDSPSLYYANGGWLRSAPDITALVSGATMLKVRLLAWDYGYILTGADPDEHTAAPFFDNVQILIQGSASSLPADYSQYPRPCALPPVDIDLEVATFTTPPTAWQGEDLTSLLGVAVRNAGTDAATGVAVRLVLAADQELTSGVEEVGLCSIAEIGAGQTVTLDLAQCAVPPRIPPTASLGNRYLGVILDPVNTVPETDEADNQDARAITITVPDVDLEVASFSVPASVDQGQNLADLLELVVRNVGTLSATDVTVRLVLAADAALTSGLEDVGLCQVPAIAAGQALVLDLAACGVPPAVPPQALGPMFIGVILDPANTVPETDESDNTAVQAITITVPTPEVDLEIISFTAPAGAEQRQDLTGQLAITVRNSGPEAMTTGSGVDVLLGPNADLSGATSLTYCPLPALGPGEEVSVDLGACARPPVVPFLSRTGDLYIGAVVDGGGAITETDETNNQAVHPITITALPRSTVYYEDFQLGPAGWTPVNLNLPDAELHLHRTTHFDGIQDRGVWWCGEESAAGWSTSPGYGNDWDQSLSKTFALPASGPVAISWDMQYDTEPDYDWITVRVSTDGGTSFADLDRYDGSSGGQYLTREVDLAAYAGQTVVLRFTFTSDGSYSDEDGYYDSDGAFRLDAVRVTGYAADTFESGDDGWVPSAGGADYLEATFRLESEPACSSGLPCDSYSAASGGGPIVGCNAWVVYDSVTGEFPEVSAEQHAQGLDIQVGIESPVLTLPADRSGVILAFDVFGDLPLENGVFYRWQISTSGGVSWQNSQGVTYSVGGWRRAVYDLTSLIGDATALQVRLIAWDIGYNWDYDPDHHTAAPFFDNVQLIVTESSDPGVNASLYPRPCGTTVADLDSDGVLDADDGCPGESAACFDRDGDGCPDAVLGARHIEYWADGTLPLGYRINEEGAPNVGDGSDLTAIQDGFAAWGQIPGAELAVQYLGTTTQADAEALDLVNLVTFSDPDFVFPRGVIAVGLSTSFTTPVWEGDSYRPGQIVDCDMIFNPQYSFGTTTQGGDIDLRGVATHEAGHMLGLSHSAVVTSTMFYVLPPAGNAASLEVEDRLAMLRAYPSAATLATASHLRGTVVDGTSGLPVPGAIVFAISAATGDTLCCDYTLPEDGSFHFLGLPDGDYWVAIHPLDGTSPIGYLEPGNINYLIAEEAQTVLAAEYWDADESATDDPAARSPVSVAAGATAFVGLITNVDSDGPTIVAVSPAPEAGDVAIDAAILVRFDEALDGASLKGNFVLSRELGGPLIPGSAALVEDGRTLAYVPAANLSFATPHHVVVRAGVKDIFGNAMAAAETLSFTTQVRPPVALTDLSPRKGPAGSLVVLAGDGFAEDPAQNLVQFGAEILPVVKGDARELVVAIPDAAPVGNTQITVTNQAAQPAETSNALAFTILPPEDVARGQEIATVDLGSPPRALTVSPDGAHVYVATAAGLSLVDATVPEAPQHVPLAVAEGLDELCLAPGGQCLLAVSAAGGKVCRFQVEPPLLLSELEVDAVPRGLLLDPASCRAYVPTDAGEIQVWDLRQGSATYESRIGTFAVPDAGLNGRLALDPARDRLLALSGAGRVLAFDLATGEQVAAAVLPSPPQDLVIDHADEILYVSDREGQISLLSLEDLEPLLDVIVGGEPRGLDLTVGGTFAVAADYLLNYLDFIDLRPASPTYRQVATRLPQRVNPVDAAFSADGVYLFSLAEGEQKLVISAAGAGPVLSSLSVRAGPAGARLVLAGSGLAGGRVFFGNTEAPVQLVGDDRLSVAVPAGATSGLVTVLGTTEGAVSNSLDFQRLGPTATAGFRPQASVAPVGAPPLSTAVAISPDGKLTALGSEDGNIHLLDTDAGSRTYYTFLDQTTVASAPLADIAFTPDGRQALAIVAGSPDLAVIDTDRGSAGFGGIVRAAALGAVDPSHLAVSPDGRCVAVSDPGTAAVRLLELGTDAVHVVALAEARPGLNGTAGELAFHPAGLQLYVTVHDDTPSVVLVLDADPDSPTFGAVVGAADLPAGAPAEIPLSLSFTPDGSHCLVLTSQYGGAPQRSLVALGTALPASPALLAATPLPTGAPPADDLIRVSPAGDQVLLSLGTDGLRRFAWPSLVPIDGLDLDLDAAPLALAGDPDGSRIFLASTQTDSLHAFEFSADKRIVKVWGDGQTGIIGQTLASPLRVRVTDLATGEGTPGVPVTFRVASGGGRLAADVPTAELVVGTDAWGYAQTSWILGPVAGGQTLEAAAMGTTGSPVLFAATAVQDPVTQPLTVVESLLAPPPGATDVSVTTAVQVVFSRSLDPTSVGSTDFFLSGDGGTSAVPAVLGLADKNRKLSLTPRQPLQPGAVYTIVLGPGLADLDGGLLLNPQTPSFTTATPLAAPELSSISPPSAPATMRVVLSGGGFGSQPADNVVWFNDKQATVIQAATDWLVTTVPIGAVTGPVRVETAGQSSGSLPFTVLVPKTTPADVVVATVGTGSATRTVTVSPDGTILYAVSPEADLIVPIQLATLTTLPGIPVGDEPWAIAGHPGGDFLYVANRRSGDVSVIDTDPTSPSWHQAVATLEVGASPVDIAVTPDGDRVLVANYGSSTLSVIDSDESSASFNRVIASAATGSAARTVTVSPDGGRIYVGTENGYLVLDPVQYGVVRSVDSGTAVKTVTVSPDGTLLVLVDTQGGVWIYDVAEGSDRQDQVIATAPTGSAVKTATVSPDGALLLLILERGDAILVFTLDIGTGIRVLAPDAGQPLPQLTLVATLHAGENPEWIAFDPLGSGTFYVTNGGDRTVSVFGHVVTPPEGDLAGRVYANCPAAGTGLLGVEVDVFAPGSGELLQSLVTDEAGNYGTSLATGDYTLTLVTPLGYLLLAEEQPVKVAGGDSLTVDWSLYCTPIVPTQRTMSFWKHQVGVALRGHGQYEIDGPTLCGYLDLIEAHFNANTMNPVVVYLPPEDGDCTAKLTAARDLFNLEAEDDVLSQARQELMALLFNVAGGKLGLWHVVSSDGTTVARAITYVDHLIDDGDPANDERAMKVAKDINKGKPLVAGTVPPVVPNIAYAAPRRFDLGACAPNPFNPYTSVAYDIAQRGRVRLEIYDLAGRLVRTLVDDVVAPGSYTAVWNGRDDRGRQAASGVYFCRLRAGDFVKTRKMMLVK